MTHYGTPSRCAQYSSSDQTRESKRDALLIPSRAPADRRIPQLTHPASCTSSDRSTSTQSLVHFHICALRLKPRTQHTNSFTTSSAQSSNGSPYSLPASPDCVEMPHMSLSAPPLGPSSTCRYAGKKCLNLRALKRNGSLHNLCHYHRVRANQNQRRMELRRRIKRVHEEKDMGVVHHPAYYTMPSSVATAAIESGSYSALLRSEDSSTTHWDYFGDLPPASGMLPPPPQQDRLSELFSAPSHGHYVADLPYTTYTPLKYKVASYHHQYPALFLPPPPADLHSKGRFSSFHPEQQQQVVWCDQDLLLPL